LINRVFIAEGIHMRRFGKTLASIALIAAAPACSEQVIRDDWVLSAAWLDLTVTDAAGDPAASREVSVLGFAEPACGDPGNAMLDQLRTGSDGRVQGEIRNMPLDRVDGCVVIRVRGGTEFRDTVVSGFAATFRMDRTRLDTIRTTIELTAR
jgi:hypothetical protein